MRARRSMRSSMPHQQSSKTSTERKQGVLCMFEGIKFVVWYQSTDQGVEILTVKPFRIRVKIEFRPRPSPHSFREKTSLENFF